MEQQGRVYARTSNQPWRGPDIDDFTRPENTATFSSTRVVKGTFSLARREPWISSISRFMTFFPEQRTLSTYLQSGIRRKYSQTGQRTSRVRTWLSVPVVFPVIIRCPREMAYRVIVDLAEAFQPQIDPDRNRRFRWKTARVYEKIPYPTCVVSIVNWRQTATAKNVR